MIKEISIPIDFTKPINYSPVKIVKGDYMSIKLVLDIEQNIGGLIKKGDFVLNNSGVLRYQKVAVRY